MSLQFFDQINPIFRPALERPQGYDKIQQQAIKTLQDADFQRKLEETQAAAKLKLDAQQTTLTRNLEAINRYKAKSIQNSTFNSSTDLDDDQTLILLQNFVKDHLIKFFQSNLEAPKDETAAKFSKILAFNEALKHYIIDMNLKDRKSGEREGIAQSKLRPERLFKPSEFYGKIVKQFVKDVLQGQQSMGKGFRAVKFDGQAINAKNMKNAEEEAMFG
ncbi:hypothetical protein SS50377_20882 [Spironucleus salmonicida]|uniref:Uncharacterized protein n=1 Tax=Spironucleus salmonicida TaxID=348837 RepID=V6LGX5_9EUKA|nr:hypothetical protein SS50377_20882 [Spironucleus salmonicida]|eukprot:EST43558.1 Hypothetical protein SS50377_16596 [Spironucleus salmonicida]